MLNIMLVNEPYLSTFTWYDPVSMGLISLPEPDDVGDEDPEITGEVERLALTVAITKRRTVLRGLLASLGKPEALALGVQPQVLHYMTKRSELENLAHTL